MRRVMLVWSMLLGAWASPPLVAAEQPAIHPRGHAFFATSFDGSDALRGWSGPATLAAGFQGGQSLVIQRAAAGTTLVTRELPVEQMRGYVVTFSARIKADHVSTKPQPWNGVKFMAPMTTGRETTWPAADIEAGSFADIAISAT
jgi:hypothetical protein